MTVSPMLWGAGLACALGGAIAGNVLGSAPILDRPAIGDFYQAHESAQWPEADGQAPPDHYPLVTRAGTVPVGELSMRGLYSQRRYRANVYFADYRPAQARAEEYRFEDDGRNYAGAGEIPAIGVPAAGEAAREPEAPKPLRLAAEPAPAGPEGNARLIDVNATLAVR